MPGGLTPNGGAASNTPTLGWSRVSGAARYEVQVDDDGAFASPAFTASTTNIRVVSDKVLPGQPHSWRVRAVSSTGAASAWAVGSINVATVGVPTPISPVSGSLQPPQDVPLLTWTGVAGATSYTVQVDETDDFISPLSTTQTRVTSYVAGPLPTGSYFWRVKATRASGVESAWSAAAGFSVGELPKVTIDEPADDPGNEITDVILDWQPVAGAAYYQLQVSADVDFNTLIDPKTSNVDATTQVFGTRYSPKVTYDNNQYYWRVRAVDTNGNPAPWSDINAQFKRVWKDLIEPVYPLGAVEEGATHIDGDPYFEWTPVAHATEYELQLGTDPDYSPGTYHQCRVVGTTYVANQFQINHDSGATTTGADDNCQVGPGTVYYWRVRPLDRPFTGRGIEGLYTQPQTFVWDDQVIPDASHMSPVGGATVAIPTLTWSPVRDAVSYKVSIKNRTGGTVKSNVVTYSTSYTPTGSTTSSSALVPADGPFTWSVQAVPAGGTPSTLIRTGTFNVSTPVPDTAAAPLTALAGADPTAPTTRAPALRWEPDPDAAYYKVLVGNHESDPDPANHTWFAHTSADVFGLELAYPAVTDTGTRLLSTGYYDWVAVAYDSNDNELGTSAVNTFRIASLDAAAGEQIALRGSTLDAGDGCTDDPCVGAPATPVYDWEPVDGAGLYIVYVSEDEDFTNLTEDLSRLGATTNTRYTPTLAALHSALPDSQSGASYYWYVRPCKTPVICAASPVSTGVGVDNSFRKSSPKVNLLVPATDTSATTTEVSTPEVTFSWQDYRDTNAATTWPATGEASTQSAMQYRIQVDNDSTFASPIDSVEVDQPTYTAFNRMYPDGELFWRVQAIDAEGNSLTWSDTREFTKTTAAPTATSPEAGAAVPGTAVFRWNALPFTGSYDLEVYKDGDLAASAVNRVVQANTKQPAWVSPNPLPASDADYVWRVRRLDGTGSKNPGAWSGMRRFRSQGAAPSLLSPANATVQNANGPLFTWTPVAGAAAYRVEVKNAAGSNLTGTPKTTPATAWATLAKVPDGSWQWRVVALDAGSSPAALGTSAWRTFKVDASAPTITSLTPTIATPTTSFTARFSEPVRNVAGSTLQIRRAGTSTWLRTSVTLSSDRLRAVLNPSANLVRGASYVITATSTITDLNGNRLVTKSWTVRVS